MEIRVLKAGKEMLLMDIMLDNLEFCSPLPLRSFDRKAPMTSFVVLSPNWLSIRSLNSAVNTSFCEFSLVCTLSARAWTSAFRIDKRPLKLALAAPVPRMSLESLVGWTFALAGRDFTGDRAPCGHAVKEDL